MTDWICGTFSMPNTQPTMQRFWAEPVRVRNDMGIFIDHTTAADAMLELWGSTRATCRGLSDANDCRMYSDVLCGKHTAVAHAISTPAHAFQTLLIFIRILQVGAVSPP